MNEATGTEIQSKAELPEARQSCAWWPAETSDEDALSLADIELKAIENINLGFDPGVLQTLDNEAASAHMIEAIKDEISQELVARLFLIANSTFFGKLRAGSVETFFDVIMRLGTKPAKVYILMVSIFSLGKDHAMKVLCAKSFATSIVGRLLAAEMGLRDAAIKKVELGGLFHHMGRIIAHLYVTRYDGVMLTENFVRTYAPYIGIRVVQKFKLPDFLCEMLTARHIGLNADGLNLSALVHVAHCSVSNSFGQHGRMVVRGPLTPITEGAPPTAASIMAEQFAAIGLGEFLSIIEPEQPKPPPKKKPKKANPEKNKPEK